MGELWFVGLGLGDELDVSARALGVLRRCRAIFSEEYTAVWSPGAFGRLAALVGRPILSLTREEVEGEQRVLSALAEEGDVAFVAVGDPFAATTHLALRLAAEKAGHRTHYLPNASILSAASGVLGLIPYRFGRVVSLPFPEPGFRPNSMVEVVRRNREHGLHTLVLLDLRPSEGRFLTATEGLRILLERDPERAVFTPRLSMAVIARVGREDQRAWYGSVERLLATDFGGPMHTLVVPAPELHFEETEALERFRV